MKEIPDTHVPYTLVRRAYELLVVQAFYTNDHTSQEQLELIEQMTPLMEEWDRHEKKN